MKKIFIHGCILSFIASLLGCSADQKTVSGKPAEIPERLEKVTNETGCLIPDSMTIFLWPEFSNENEATEGVRIVNTAATDSENFMKAIYNLGAEEQQSKRVFDDHKCLTYAHPTNKIRYKVKKWKQPPPDPAQDPAGAEEYKICGEVQKTLDSYTKQVDDIRKQAEAPIGIIYKTVDPGYPSNPVGNIISLDAAAANQRFDFVQGDRGIEVKISFKDLQEVGNHQSTDPEDTTLKQAGSIQDARYSTENKNLKFRVPQVFQGNLTGGMYEFSLGRSNFVGKARFSGDFRLVKADGTIRAGSANLYGELLPFDNPKCQE